MKKCRYCVPMSTGPLQALLSRGANLRSYNYSLFCNNILWVAVKFAKAGKHLPPFAETIYLAVRN